MSELRPCPFCGCAGLITEQSWVTCPRCGTFGPSCDRAAGDAIAAWNRRTPNLAAIRAAVEAERVAWDELTNAAANTDQEWTDICHRVALEARAALDALLTEAS